MELSEKIWNDIKKYLLLGEDIKNKSLYPDDFIEVCVPFEMKSSWCSPIYWHPLHGAFINSNPNSFLKQSKQRELASIMHNMKKYEGKENLKKFRPTVKKITEAKYNKWLEKQKEK